MSITTVGNHLVHYEALGRGKPLIFIHGWLGSWRYWWPSMQSLSTHYRTFALDLWGFGDSSKAQEKYSLSEYVDLLHGFLQRLGIATPVALVGHAVGAAVVVRYALEHPQRVARLAVVSLPLKGEHLNRRLVQGSPTNAAGRIVGKGTKHPELELELDKTDPAAVTALADEIGQADFSTALGQVSCPLMLVFGAQDPLIRQPNGNSSLLEAPPTSQAYVTLDSCMHFPMLEEKAKFNRLLLDFLHADSDLSNLSPKDYWQRRTY